MNTHNGALVAMLGFALVLGTLVAQERPSEGQRHSETTSFTSQPTSTPTATPTGPPIGLPKH